MDGKLLEHLTFSIFLFIVVIKIGMRFFAGPPVRNSLEYDDFVKSPSAVLRFTFVVEAYFVSTPHASGFACRVPRNAGELFTKPSLWRLLTRSSKLKTGGFCLEHWNLFRISDFRNILFSSGYAGLGI